MGNDAQKTSEFPPPRIFGVPPHLHGDLPYTPLPLSLVTTAARAFVGYLVYTGTDTSIICTSIIFLYM